MTDKTPEGHLGSGLVFWTSGGGGGRSFLAGLGAASEGNISISGAVLVGAGAAAAWLGSTGSSLSNSLACCVSEIVMDNFLLHRSFRRLSLLKSATVICLLLHLVANSDGQPEARLWERARPQ